MKKTTAAFFVGAAMLVPFVSSASIVDDLRAQVASLTALLQSLQAKVQSLAATNVSTGGNLAAVGTATSASSVTVVSPNGGEVFVQGQRNMISWTGGKGAVSVALVKSTTANKANLMEQNLIVGWIAAKAAPNSSVLWNATSVCDLSMTSCRSVSSGSYKVLVVSQDDSGNLTMWDYKQNKAGNWDVSDSAFSIK